MSELEAGYRQLSVDLLRRSVEQGDELERLAREAHEIARVAIGQRDALAAVIEEARAWAGPAPFALSILSRTPSDVLVERDARIRAEVIDWLEQNLAGEDSPAWARSASRSMLSMPAAMEVIDSAREHFGLTEGG